VVEGGDVTNVDVAQDGRFAEIGCHDLSEREERFAIRLDAAFAHEDVTARGDQHRIDD